MQQLERLVDTYQDRLESVLRRACVALSTNVIVRTPVDSGVLRASWTPSINGEDGSNRGGSVLAMMNNLRLGDSFSLINAQPYARRIEYEGWSQQAPSGMLRISVMEWPGIVAQEINRAR